MVDINELSMFLNAENCKDGDIVVIIDEGSFEAKTDKDGRPFKVLNMKVETNGRKVTYSPNSDAQKVFKKAFGADTKKWVGCKFQIKIYPKLSYGVTKDAILPVLIVSEKVEYVE